MQCFFYDHMSRVWAKKILIPKTNKTQECCYACVSDGLKNHTKIWPCKLVFFQLLTAPSVGLILTILGKKNSPCEFHFLVSQLSSSLCTMLLPSISFFSCQGAKHICPIVWYKRSMLFFSKCQIRKRTRLSYLDTNAKEWIKF